MMGTNRAIDIGPDGVLPSSVPAITVQGLWRRYRAGRGHTEKVFDAVRGVDLTVHHGEVFALLGTNGAGKTSTVEIIEGLAPPSEGSVRVLGQDPYTGRRLVRPRTGTLLQNSGFPPALTVREMARMWHGTLRSSYPIDDMLDAVGLDHSSHVLTASLSGGERRRLDLALTLMTRADVLILDEPTTGLDPESRHRMWTLIRERSIDHHALSGGSREVCRPSGRHARRPHRTTGHPSGDREQCARAHHVQLPTWPVAQRPSCSCGPHHVGTRSPHNTHPDRDGGSSRRSRRDAGLGGTSRSGRSSGPQRFT